MPLQSSCRDCGKTIPADKRRCLEHERLYEIRRRGGLKPLGATTGWAKLRAEVLKRDLYTCQLRLEGCTVEATAVDHVIPRIRGGEDSLDNCVAACGSCNSKKGTGGWIEIVSGDSLSTRTPKRAKKMGQLAALHTGRRASALVVLCGASATGKTEIRRRIAEQTGFVSLGPDDCAGDWNAIYDALDLSERAIVECCRLPRALRQKTKQRRTTIVELITADSVRRERLLHRGEPEHDLERLMAHGSLGYEEHITPDLTVRTDELTPEQAAEAVLTTIRRNAP